MKYLILTCLLILSFQAFCMGGKPPQRRFEARKDQDKLWHVCQKSETSENLGKFCSRHCLVRKDPEKRFSKCEKWGLRIRNYCDMGDFEFFRNSSFILIDEDNL